MYTSEIKLSAKSDTRWKLFVVVSSDLIYLAEYKATVFLSEDDPLKSVP